ncbi:MAG: hypothetical protein JHD33_01565 [Chthoniobacterales bacterium]|nr:hypothetical protein [Chthoniobacterales bacterium]
MPKPRRRKPPQGNRLNASFAAAGDAVTVPVRYVKFFVGLFLLPVCYVLTAAFFSALIDAMTSQVAGRAHFWMTPQFWFFTLGLVCWLIAYFGLPKWVTGYVFGHELTHALVVLLMGGRVSQFSVGRDGGHIVSSKINTWIALAPYFIPIYSVFVIAIYGVVAATADLGPHRDLADGILYFLLGATWCFHACFTVAMIPKGQSDLHYGGTFFSLTIIYLMNLLVLSALLILATPYVSFASFARETLAQAQSFAAEAAFWADAVRRAWLH